MRDLSARLALGVALIYACFAGSSRADVVLDQTKLIGLPGVAAPVEYSFTTSTAQALTLTLTDLAQPAAFSSLEVAVTLGDTLVGIASVDTTTPSPTLAIPAAAGNYTLHVIGTPNAAQGGIGFFNICVALATSPTNCISTYSGSITTPAVTSSTGTSQLSTTFTSTIAGNYTVTLTDDAFPVALAQPAAGGIALNGNAISALAEGTQTVALVAGASYQLLVGAVANATTLAGLYGISITDPNGKVIFDRTIPVGTLPGSTIVDNTAAQGLSLNLTDYGYPTALASVGVAVTQGSTLLTALTAPGSATNFMAAAGNVEVWQYAVAGTQPGTYGVGLSVYQSNPIVNLLSTTQVVNVAGAAATSFAFIATLPSAGTYNLVANDFQFPAALGSISATVAQNGTVLPVTSGNFTAPQAGAVVVLVNATPPGSGSGIFGVTVKTSGANPQVLLDQTQAVGGIFNTQVLTLGTSGNFSATLTDLAFPQKFQDLAVVVSQNSQVLGKIYAQGGTGTFQFSGAPGNYVVSLVAAPDSQTISPPSLQNYGLYSLQVASATPTVTLKSSASSVTAGGTVTLTWSSENATACTASGGTGWTGSEATSGTLGITVSATETLTLTCTGPGGSAAQSITVTATPATSKSSGGGGAMDLAWTLALMSLCALSYQRRLRGLRG
jgi:plastocyanin